MSNDPFELFCEVLALAYHEARNVRHLVRGNLISPVEPWRRLIDLPTNRDHAWVQFTPLLHEAKSVGNGADATTVFSRRFDVDLEELERMFANPNWRGSGFGGNAWARITARLRLLRDAILSHDDEAARESAAALYEERHNTGSLREKFEKLQRPPEPSGL